MCKRNCIYRGGVNKSWNDGESTCNYSAASWHAGSKHQTRTGVIMEMLGKTQPDEEVRELLRGECCPLYVWNGEGKPQRAKKPENLKKAKPEKPESKKYQYHRNVRPEQEKLIREAYGRGLSDNAISRDTGVDVKIVAYWRAENGLESNFSKNMAGKKIDEEKCMQLYRQGLTDGMIGKEFGVSGMTIWLWRQRNNLKTNFNRGPISQEEREKRLALWKAGKADTEISAAVGVSERQIREWRRREHLPANDRRRNMKVDPWLLRSLYDQGLNDRQVAERAGCTSTLVNQWRHREGLPVNKTQRQRIRENLSPATQEKENQ